MGGGRGAAMTFRTMMGVALAVGLALGCDGDGEDPDGGGGGSDSGVTDGGGTADGGGDAGGDIDAGGDTDAGPAARGCPSATLPSITNVTYMGSTVGAANLFESNRLEWQDAGDEALLFVVPETGVYRFAMDDMLTTNQGCAISVSDGVGDTGLHTVAQDCPSPGTVRQLPDAFFIAGEGFSDTISLDAGTELLVLVSCAYWSQPTEVDYTLTITRE